MSEPSIEFYNAAIDAVQAGKLPEALTAVENSLTEDPQDAETWQIYVVILNALGRTDDAEKASRKLRELGISAADERLIQAAECAASGNLPAAIFHYESALALEPDRPEIHASYALTLMDSGKQTAALAAAEKAVALAPDDSHANYALGHILRLAGNKEAALTALSKAVETDPGFMMAVYEEGMLLAEAGQLEKALGNFEKFLKFHPGDPSAMEAVREIRAVMNGGS